jgi:hypothetical protein
MNAFYDKNGNSFIGIVAECSDEMEDFVIREKMLDGTFAVQKVGAPSTSLDVVFYCSRETRRSVELASANGDLVMLSWRGINYSGYLDDVKHEKHWPHVEIRQEKIKFKLLVEAIA